MAKAKKSKKSKSAKIMFIITTILFLASLAVAIGFSVIPYSTMTAYTMKDKDNDLTYNVYITKDGEDFGLKFETIKKDKDPVSLEIPFSEDVLNKACERGDLTPFKYSFNETLLGFSIQSGEYTNAGNIAIVTVFSIVAALSLALALVNAKKAF